MNTTATHLRRGRPAIIAVMLVAVLVGVGACSSIPTTGPVGTMPAENPAGDTDTPNYNVHGPTGNENPQAIISGFLEAGLDSSDNYSVARQYLTSDLAGKWDATAGVLVTNGETTFDDAAGKADSGQQRVKLAVEREIDEVGLRKDVNREVKLKFGLEKVDHQWRISRAPDGLVLDRANFSNVVSPVTLWFYSDDSYSHLVPDLRWMVRRQGRSASVVSALFDGPAPYLDGAVVSAFPDGAKLSRNSVPIEDGSAIVDVPESVVSGAGEPERTRMLQQLKPTLEDNSSVKDVSFTVGGNEISSGSSPVAVPTADADGALAGLAEDTVVRFKDGKTTPVKGGDGVGTGLSDVTIAPNQDAYALLAEGSSRLRVLDPAGKSRTLTRGNRLAAPSYDLDSWIWTASTEEKGRISAYRASGSDSVDLEPDWLEDDRVTGLRVSLDGARLAMVVERKEEDKSNLYLLVSGIHRDKKGRPTGLSEPLDLGVTAEDSTRVAWAAGDKLVVYKPGRGDRTQPQTSGLDLQHDSWPPILRLSSLAAAPSRDHEAIAVNGDGTVYRRDQQRWREIGKGVEELSYRG